MPFGLKENDYKLIKNVFHSISKIEEVIVFGSRAMGTEKPGSDVDLALKGNDITLNDILKLKHKLEELPIIYDFDVINYDTINTPALIEHIDRHGILFYKKDIVPNEWKTYKLGDFAEINPKFSLKQGQEYSFVEMKDLDATFKYVSPSTKKELKGGSKFQNGDTLFARITPCLENGKICQVKNLNNNLGFGSTEFLVFRGRKNVSDSDFVYYLSRSEFVKNNAIQLMTGSSGRQRVEKSSLEELEIIVPKDINTQNQIAQILTSLDDKIELNLQMNQTLEAMAQAMFKEWFVDFKFPGFDGMLVDELPKGWKKEPLDEKISFLNGLALQKFPPKNETDYLPVIKIKELKQGLSESSDKASTDIDKRYIIEDGDILFSWSGSLEVVMWCNGKGALNQHLFKVSSEKYPKWFYYYWVKEYLSIFQATAADKATTMGHIQRRHLTESLINVPDKSIMKLANDILEPLLERIKSNAIQMQTLIQTRDNLLPRLMSGKIKIL